MQTMFKINPKCFIQKSGHKNIHKQKQSFLNVQKCMKIVLSSSFKEDPNQHEPGQKYFGKGLEIGNSFFLLGEGQTVSYNLSLDL
jgi:hypothetical protein